MLTYAYVDGQKISIDEYDKTKHQAACCSMGHSLIGKKGSIVVHHFAHRAGQECDKWRDRSMTRWHAQWQDIVSDPAFLEVCLDESGNIVGYSSFNGYRPSQNMTTTPHIADIIKPHPDPNQRPLVIEIQHSPINEENVLDREKYYQNMIWVFDFTPRIVNINSSGGSNFNRLSFIDGKMVGLRDKVGYLAVLNASTSRQTPKPGPYTGDLSREMHDLCGTFVIVHTQTKYWFAARTPTYFDTGFCILRLLKVLERGFAILQMMTYSQFFLERMPPLNSEKILKMEWFRDISDVVTLNKLGLLPPAVDVTSIRASTEKMEILYPGTELQQMGFVLRTTKEHPNGVWCAGKYYTGIPNREIIPNVNKSEQEYLSELQTKRIIAESLYGKVEGVNEQTSALSYESSVKTRLFMYLDLDSRSIETEIAVVTGNKTLILHCNKETYHLKNKFKAIGMEYRKGGYKKAHQLGIDKPKTNSTYRISLAILDANLKAHGF